MNTTGHQDRAHFLQPVAADEDTDTPSPPSTSVDAGPFRPAPFT
jgi:hypothetical protein